MVRRAKRRKRSGRKLVRYGFPVPRRYNSGKRVEPLKFWCLEILLVEFFKGYSQQAGFGGWEKYPKEKHVKYEIDVPNNQFNRRFFKYFRGVLEKWFRQERIWMTRVKIDLV